MSSNDNGGGPWGQGPSGGPEDDKNQDPWKKHRTPKEPNFDALFQKSQKEFKKIFGGGSGGSGPTATHNKKFLGLALFGLAALWAFSGVFTVQQDQQGAILRFGKYVRTVDPGLNYHFPYPIEDAIVRNVTSLNVFTNNEAREDGTLMLTGDENIVAVQYAVTWYIDNLEGFLFSAKDPEPTIRTAVESTVRSIIAQTPISRILSEGRTEINLELRERLQKLLANYGLGVNIKEVKLLKTTPPTTAVEDAYLDVQRARADLERKRNEADFYRNSIVPVARGDAKKLLEEAKAYDAKVRKDIEGETSRFLNIYTEYKKAPGVTRTRMYLETVGELFKGSTLLITDDQKSQGVVPYLPLPELKKAEPKKED